MLVVSPDSWHFAYFRWIRSLYGAQPTDQTSLCKYCQTMLWGSIFFVFFSPIIIVGWILAKVASAIIKLQGKRIDRICEWLNDKIKFSEDVGVITKIEAAADDFRWSPILTGFSYTIFGAGSLAVAVMALAVVGVILYGIGLGIWHIGDILGGVWGAVLHLGYVGWWFFGLIGYGMHYAGAGISWLFTNGSLWATVGIWAAWIVSGITVVGGAAFVMGNIAMRVGKIPFVTSFFSGLANWLNGLSDARRMREERLSEAKRADNGVKPWTCSYCNFRNTNMNYECESCERDKPDPSCETAKWEKCILYVMNIMAAPFGWTGAQIGRVRGAKHHVLSGWDVVWEGLKSFKQGICPIVRIATSDDLQAEAIAEARKLHLEQSGEDPMILTRDQASEVWSLLMGQCGAWEGERDDFIYHARESRGVEYRFQGHLGFGGKIYLGEPPHVACYSEDETPRRKRMVKAANVALNGMYRAWLLAAKKKDENDEQTT